jgi:hypothetical protein
MGQVLPQPKTILYFITGFTLTSFLFAANCLERHDSTNFHEFVNLPPDIVIFQEFWHASQNPDTPSELD